MRRGDLGHLLYRDVAMSRLDIGSKVTLFWTSFWMFAGAKHGIPPEVIVLKIEAGRETASYYAAKWLNRG